MDSNIEQLQQENKKLNERLNNAAKFFKEQKAQIESLEKENSDLKNLNDQVKNENDELQKNCTDLKQSLENTENELREKLKNTDEAYEQLRQKFESNKNKITTLSEELESLKEKYNELEASKNTDEDSVKELKENFDTLTKKYDDCHQQLEQSLEYNEDLEKRIESVEFEKLAIESDYNLLKNNQKVLDKIVEVIKEFLGNDDTNHNDNNPDMVNDITEVSHGNYSPAKHTETQSNPFKEQKFLIDA